MTPYSFPQHSPPAQQLRSCPLSPSGVSDFELINDILARHGTDANLVGFAHMRAAERLVGRRWTEIEVVAEALLKTDELTGAQVEAIVAGKPSVTEAFSHGRRGARSGLSGSRSEQPGSPGGRSGEGDRRRGRATRWMGAT